MRSYIKIYEEFINDDEFKNQILDLIPDIIDIEDITISFSPYSDTFSIYAENKNLIINKISEIFKKDIYRMDRIMSNYYDIWYTLKEADGESSIEKQQWNIINRRNSQLKGLIENLDKYESSVFVELIFRFKNKKEDELH